MALAYVANTIDVYRRILKASRRGTGTRLTSAEVLAIALDDAVQQAVRVADLESQDKKEGN